MISARVIQRADTTARERAAILIACHPMEDGPAIFRPSAPRQQHLHSNHRTHSMSAALSPTRSIEALSPFRRSPEIQTGIAAKIAGTIPDWLRGERVRPGPAVFETRGWRAHHWFDGLGMIYAFRIGGSGVDFRSRLLDSETARDAWGGKSNHRSFGTPTALPLLQRIF